MANWAISNNQEVIGVVAYRMQVSNAFKIHDIFHVSHLWLFIIDGKVQPPCPPIFKEDASYEVERVLQSLDNCKNNYNS